MKSDIFDIISFVLFFCFRFLQSHAAGACPLWPDRRTFSHQLRLMVRMWDAHPRKMVGPPTLTYSGPWRSPKRNVARDEMATAEGVLANLLEPPMFRLKHVQDILVREFVTREHLFFICNRKHASSLLFIKHQV